MSSLRRFAAFRSVTVPCSVAAITLSAAPAFADELVADQTDIPTIVIGATRLPTPQDQVGTDVTVITADDIEKKQERTLPDVLQDVPGLNLVQTGSPGGTASVYLRGTNPNHTKVLVDGIDISDPSSTDGSVDLSQILATDIERVEVLRGPQSGLYGSEAMGGVINIITKKGEGPPKLTGSIEGGSYGTFNQTAGVSGSLARFNYNASFEHYRTGATQVTPTNLLPPGVPLNDDVYDNKTYATKLGANLTDNFDVGVVARYVDTNLVATSDDPFGAGPEPQQSYSLSHELVTRGTGHLVLFDGIFDQTVGLGFTDYHRYYTDPNANAIAAGGDPSDNFGNRTKADWQGNIHVTAGQVVTLGAEHERDTINDSNPANASVVTNSGYAQLQSNFGAFSNTASLRYDSNSQFGNAATYRLAPVYAFADSGTTVRGSVGTGFKAPSLDQLYDNYPAFGVFANPNLVPETSLGWDIGAEQSLLDKRVDVGTTYFHNDIKNLITFNSAGTSLINVGQATTYGFENFVSYKPWDVLTLRADYTYTMAVNASASVELPRRPKHKASLNVTWQATDRLSFTGGVLYTGAWRDSSRVGSANFVGSPYTIVNIAGSYDLGHGVTAFGRIDNLTNRIYQDPVGFQHQGLGVFGGFRVALDTATWKE